MMLVAANGKAIRGDSFITYQQLFMILLDFQKYQQTSPAFMILNASKIKRFYEQNNMRIQQLNKKMHEIAVKYAKKTEDGRLSVIRVNGHDEYEFDNEEAKASYLSEHTDFMNIGFELHI